MVGFIRELKLKQKMKPIVIMILIEGSLNRNFRQYGQLKSRVE